MMCWNWRSIGCVYLFFAFAIGEAAAAVTSFSSRVDRNQIRVGERFNLTLEVSSNEGFIQATPTRPDFGGLTLVSGPNLHQQTVVSGIRTASSMAHVYELSAPAPGSYTIGKSVLEADGQRYETEPILVAVLPADLTGLPPSLKGEPILNPVTNNRIATDMLRGKAFVRPWTTKKNPYVGEPVVFTYDLYISESDARERRFNLTRISQPKFEGMMTEVDYELQPGNRDDHSRRTVLDGQAYIVFPLYRVILTPTHAGEFPMPQYTVGFTYPFGAPGFRGPAGLFDDPRRSPRIDAEVASGSLVLNVRPLPQKGKPANFTGTVGSFTMKSEIDRTSVTEDDLIQLDVTIEGIGNPSTAAVPELPETNDFELYETSPDAEKYPVPEGLQGKKTIEYLLHPKRSGKLTIPPIAYAIFDPITETYKTLTTEPHTIDVSPGQKPAIPGNTSSAAAAELMQHLRFAKPIYAIEREAPKPLIENPLFWLVQLAVAGAALGLMRRARRLERADPAELRRGGAFDELDRKIRKVRELAGKGEMEPAASALERALREFIGDWFNLSPDGLTIDEIARLLHEQGLAPDRADEFRRIIETCATIRYAPVRPTSASFDQWTNQARAILLEAFR